MPKRPWQIHHNVDVAAKGQARSRYNFARLQASFCVDSTLRFLDSLYTLWYIFLWVHRIPAIHQKASPVGCDSADDVLRAIQDELEKKPERGSMVWAQWRAQARSKSVAGKGKRGGFRYLYLY